MVDPVGFAEAWKAQFPDSEPPKMELRSVGDIERELERCKASIRRLELEVNKERFRMIYLQTLLAKEKKSYDRQRWGFKRVSRVPEGSGEEPSPERAGPSPPDPGPPDGAGEEKAGARAPSSGKPSARSDGSDASPPGDLPRGGGDPDGAGPRRAGERPERAAGDPEGRPADGAGSPAGRRSPPARGPAADGEGSPGPAGGDRANPHGVAALRSNFERIGKAHPRLSAEAERPFYVNVEYHHERGLVKVNDKEVSDRLGSLGAQAMQMERKKSLHALPGCPGPGSGEFPRPPYRGRSSEGGCGYDGEYEDVELNPRFLKDNMIDADGGNRPPWQPAEYRPYQSVFVGGPLGEGESKGPASRGQGASDQEKHLTWPRRSYSPRSFEDIGGGYTPDCSSNENLTSSEEDFSSGQSSHVSPSPTAYRMYRDKSRSPSQNSQQSFDSSSPPTPQSQKRHQQGQVVVSEATIVGVRKTGQIWPSDGDALSGRSVQDGAFHGDTEEVTEAPEE